MAARKPGAEALVGARRVVRVLTAAAQQVKVDARGSAKKPMREQWQTDAWDMLDLIPEVGQAVTFMANVVSGIRIYIALRPDTPDEEPGPAPDGTPGLEAANAVLERLRVGSTHGGMGGLLYHHVVNLKVPGDCYLLGQEARAADPTTDPPTPERPELWEVRSIDEVEIKDKGVAIIKDTPSDKGRKVKILGDDGIASDDPDAVFLLRVYDRHPRYKGLARSSLRAALNECDELLLLGRCVRAAARRYLAGNGLLAVPSELDLPGGPDEGDDEDAEASPLMKRLATAMVESMADETNPDSLVPLMLMGPGELLQKLQHLTFGAAFDPEARELRSAVLARLGAGLDLPIEQLTGIAKVNHWGAWQIDVASWARYGHPTARLIVESWTEGLLWPMLAEANVPDDQARRLLIWFDPAHAILDPDAGATADELFDRGAISWEAYRARKGAGEDEAPEDSELDRRAELGLLKSGASGGQVGPPQANASATVQPHTNGHKPGVVVAAARRSDPLGRRLMQIDRTLRARLEEAAGAAMRRALERAGARVASLGQRNPNLAAGIAGLPAERVPEHLGPQRVAQLLLAAATPMTEDDLLADGIDGFEDRFDSRVSQSQTQVLRQLADEFDLTPDEIAALQSRQDSDRRDAWVWLSAAMLALARDRLYNPEPQAPQVGEFDAAATVPPGVIREAMARAGGGAPADGLPAGGVGLGQLVMDVWQQNGRVVGGWEWVYGDPSTRTSPFPAHEDLDGVQFDTWEDDALAVQGGDEWLGVSYYRPGDHAWCQCDFVALDVSDSASEPSDESVDAEAVA